LHPERALLLLTVVSIFSLLTVGAYVTAAGFGGACGSDLGQDYPLCQGSLFPPLQVGPVAEYTHRLLASLSTLFLFVTAFLYWRSPDAPRSVKLPVFISSLLIILEVALGAAVVVTSEPPWLVTLHQANALLVFGLTVAAAAQKPKT
jgi:heme a synthase